MLDEKTMHAIGVLLARTARVEAEKPDADPNQVIDLLPLLQEWSPGVFEAGAVRSYKGRPVRCVQHHDSRNTPDWTPDAAPALWANYHATDAAHALPYMAPTGAHDAYKKGEWMIWTDGRKMRCARDGSVFAPSVQPKDWIAEDEKKK